VSNSSNLAINPDIPEAHELLGWFATEGRGIATTTLSNKMGGGMGGGMGDKRVLLHQIKDENMGNRPDGKADYFVSKGTVVVTRKSDNTIYKACKNDTCNKKVIQSVRACVVLLGAAGAPRVLTRGISTTTSTRAKSATRRRPSSSTA
jgi:replication factor A1